MATNNVKIVLSAEDRSKAAFGSVRSSLTQMRGQVAGLTSLFAGLIPVLTITGLAAVAKNGIDAADALNDMSARTGVAVKTLAEYKLAAQLADTSLDDLAKGIQRLTLSMGKAEQGGTAQAEALKRLGITTKDPKIAFEQLAEAVAKSDDPTRTAADLAAVLGKSYVNLLPLLQGGAKGLRDSAASSATFAESMAKLAPDAGKFNDQLDLLKTNAAGAAAQLLTSLVPILNDALGAWRDNANEIGNMNAALVGLGRLGIVGQTIGVLWANVSYVFKQVGNEIGGITAQLAALLRGDFKGAGFIGDAMKRDAVVARKEIDDLEKRIMGMGKISVAPGAVPPGSDPTPDFDPEAAARAAAAAAARKSAAEAAARAAASAARQEAAALLKAQESLEKSRLAAAAQGLEDSLATRREKLDQARKQELIDDAGFIAAKAALDEEALRNELAALQDQQSKLRAASTAPGTKGSERTQALAELALVDARIESAGQKILNLNQAATADLSVLALAKLKSQADFIDGLEQETYLSSLNNDERETALLLLEAEKLGITDVNRLLELQAETRANSNAKKAAEETARQQDDLYKSVQDGVQRAFADGLNAIASGEGGFSGALKNLVDTIRNALSNALAASLTESFLGMLGGKEGVLNIAGSIGLGGKRGETPATPMFVKDVAAGLTGGAAGADGGGMFAGFFDGIKSFFSNLTSGFSNLFSGLTKSLSGLFSGGGGGGGGSNVGGWVSTIASLFGYADGGYTGPGAKYQPAGMVHAGEYVFSADSVRRLGLGALDNLHRIAKGSIIPSGPRLSYAEGGLVNLPGSAAPNVTSNTKVVNMFNLDSALAEYLNTRGGERAILNVIQRNPRAVGG